MLVCFEVLTGRTVKFVKSAAVVEIATLFPHEMCYACKASTHTHTWEYCMAEGESKRVCLLCQHKNPSSAHYCQKCGAPLSVGTTTMNVAEHASATSEFATVPVDIDSRFWMEEGAVGLHVTGHPKPILVRDTNEIILGRAVPGDTPPTVDLTDFHAHLLGVSRKHAVIREVEGGLVVEDLNSQNGTWLNEQRLTPNNPRTLSHGDQLRLGQLILFVYLPHRHSSS